MPRRFSRSQAHQWVISVLLLALGLRALVPAGFMPSSERPFTLEICPDGFPSQLLHPEAPAHHHHASGTDEQQAGSTHDHSKHEQGARAEHCVFAAAASAAPAPYLLSFAADPTALAAPSSDFFAPVPEKQRFRVQQPRAPPALS